MFQTNTPVTYRRHWTHHELAALPRGCLMHVSLGVRVGGLYLNASVCFDTSFTRKLANAAWKWIYTLPRSVWAFEVCTQELFSFSFTYMNIRHVNLDASSYVQVYFYVQSFTADSLKIRSGLLCRLAEGCFHSSSDTLKTPMNWLSEIYITVQTVVVDQRKPPSSSNLWPMDEERD